MGGSGAKRVSQFRTVGLNSPIAHANKVSSSPANRNGNKSALNIREKPLVGQHRNNGLSSDQNNNYLSANQIAYGQKIPVVNQKELKYVLFKPETKNFDTEDAWRVREFDDREKVIKDLDNAMSPFMKNQNEHFQKIKKSVARQEQIASHYTGGQQMNYAQQEARKD